MKTFTNEQIKQIKLLQKAFCVQSALSQTLEEKAQEIEQKILNENVFIDDQGKRVTNPKYSWSICKTQFDNFFAFRREEMRTAGLGHPRENEGFSVDAVAHNNFVKLKHRIFNFALTLMPNGQRETLETGKFRMVKGEFVFDKVINLFMTLKTNS